jgi:hypothetical protein
MKYFPTAVGYGPGFPFSLPQALSYGFQWGPAFEKLNPGLGFFSQIHQGQTF